MAQAQEFRPSLRQSCVHELPNEREDVVEELAAVLPDDDDGCKLIRNHWNVRKDDDRVH